ncbi:unnamed protein product [Sphagnum troendelagicum]|uniref:Thioredoxin domain-containing protein n=1 Tax=Sphagnum troendelagicum TaxID=128251 RepID=A0ABP0TIY3_9BRYO
MMMLIQSVHFSSSSSSTTIAVAARVSSFTGHKNGHNIIQNRPQMVWSLRNRNTHKQQQKRQQLLVQRNKCCSNGSNSSSSSRLSSGMKKRVRVYGTRCKALSVTSEEEFEEVVMKSKVPVLVDFWASWCGPCKLVAPSMDKIEQKYSGQVKVVKIETDENPQLVEMYKVYGLPTLILFIDGKEVPGSRHEGAISFAKVESLLKSLLPTLVSS